MLDQGTTGTKMFDPKTKRKVYIVATGEELSKAMSVASNPVEKGSPITDHVSVESDEGSFSGYLLTGRKSGNSGKTYMNTLYEWQESATFLSWYGRRNLNKIIISNLSFKYDDKINATHVNLTWKRIRLTERPKQKAVARKKPNKKKQKGVYITVKWGMCYWEWMMKYGTSVNQLRKWNGWPDRQIPTGARARVK